MEIPHFPPRTATIITRTVRREEEDVVAFARRLGFEADETQQYVLRSTAKRGMLNCTRQWGKTTASVVKALHRAYTVPNSLVVVASPGERQSGEWLKKAADMLPLLGIEKRGDGYNKLSVMVDKGSRIVGLPHAEAKIRGYSAPTMIVIDEAARVSDAMYHALRPMLTYGGDLWMLSTPYGKQGFFYEMWEHGGPAWERVRVQATDCPRIPRDFLEEEREVMGADIFRQEHMCEFVGSGKNTFDRELVEATLDEEIDPV